MALYSGAYNPLKHLVVQEVPPEHYNKYWDRLGLEPKEETRLRKRFNRAYNRFRSGRISPTEFDQSLERIHGDTEELLFDAANELEAYEPTGEEIELSEISYDTPLLDAAEAGSVGAEATVATGGAATELGTLGAGVTLAAIGAAIYTKATTAGATVPGTNYIGPGNTLDSGTPVSGADEDARDHDVAYDKGGDVSEADTLAINQFGDHFADNHFDIPALLGTVGLSAKKAIEKHTGQLYPAVGKYGST